MNSVRPIVGPTDRGQFPSAPLFDVPPLVLVLGAQLVSDDGRPLRAVYGPDAESAQFRGWVHTLMTGGDAGVLTQMQRSQEQAVALAGHVALGAVKLVWTKVHPIAAVLLGGAVGYAYRRASPSTRQHAANMRPT